MKHSKEILRLAVPAIVTNITVPLLGLVDLTIVGHMGSERYIAAVAVGSMLFNVMYWLMGFLRMSTSGQTAQAFGAAAHGEIRRVLRRSLLMALVVACVFVLLQIPLEWLGILMMHPEASILPLVHTYFSICIWGAPAMLSLYVLTGWFIGLQNTRITMVVSISQNVLNILLSLLFVYLFGMKIEGVALGTMLAQWGGVGLALLYLRREWKQIPSAADGNDNGLSVARQVPGSTELSLFLRTVCLVSVNLFFTATGARQGNLLLSVNALLMTFFMLFSYFMDGFAYAAEALCGRYYGAKSWDAFRGVCRSLLLWGAGMIIAFTIVYSCFGEWFLHLLTSEQDVLAASRDYFPWVLLIPLAGMAAFIYDGIFIGITAARDMFIATAAATAIFFALFYLLFGSMGNHALWLALIVYLLLRGVLLHLLLHRQLPSAK